MNPTVVSGSPEFGRLADSFAQDLAAAFGVSETSFHITGIAGDRRLRRLQAANQTITFTIDHVDTLRILQQLTEQLGDPSSTLLSSPAAGMVYSGQLPAFAFVCPQALVRSVGDPQCTGCGGNQVPNQDNSACTECPPGQVPSSDSTHCVCDIGSYSVQDLPVIQCFQRDFLDVSPEPIAGATCTGTQSTDSDGDGSTVCAAVPAFLASGAEEDCPTSDNCVYVSGCYPCESECMNCSTSHIELSAGYHFANDDALVTTLWHAFKCPVPASCPKQLLVSQETAGTGRMTDHNCTEGHTGLLCGSCLAGWKRGPIGTCQKCSTTSSGALNPLLLIPIALVLSYTAVRVIVTFRRKRRLKRDEAAAALFQDLDTNRSGTITATQLHAYLTGLGIRLSQERMNDILDAVNTRAPGEINKDEFVMCELFSSRFVSAAVPALCCFCDLCVSPFLRLFSGKSNWVSPNAANDCTMYGW